MAQNDRIGRLDCFVAGCVALGACLLQALYLYPAIHPSVWNDMAIALGLRPAIHATSGFITGINTFIFRVHEMAVGLSILRCFSAFLFALIAACAYLMMREVILLVLPLETQHSRLRNGIVCGASFLGSISFVVSDPVWTCGQCFSKTTFVVLLLIFSVWWSLTFIRVKHLGFAYLAVATLGIFSAQTPLGVIVAIILLILACCVLRTKHVFNSIQARTILRPHDKRNLTAIYCITLLFGIVTNCMVFVRQGGLIARNLSLVELPWEFFCDYVSLLSTTTSWSAWLCFIGWFLLPFVTIVPRLSSACDEEQVMPYAMGIALFCSFIIALTQVSGLQTLWFWTFVSFPSQPILAAGLLLNAVIIACCFTALGIDLLCREHMVELGVEDKIVVPRTRLAVCVQSVFLCTVALVIIGVVLPGLKRTATRQRLSFVKDAIIEIAKEAKCAKYLFTDGELDVAIELGAKSLGYRLFCISLLGGGDVYAKNLRTRAVANDGEDCFSFGLDAAMGLRGWLHDKPSRIASVAAMLGFDLWKREGKPLPPMGGLISRAMGFDSEEERLRGVQAARNMAEQVQRLVAQRSCFDRCVDTEIEKAFWSVVWRISRMCTYRSDAYELTGVGDDAETDFRLAKVLNDVNPTFRQLVRKMEERRMSMMRNVTPREGLQMALARADFKAGQKYADVILSSDADNAEANFAMAMFYKNSGRLSLAEGCLKRCLVRRPNEPAIYNNLAMIQIQQRRFAEAERNVDRALELAPDAAAIIDTKRLLREVSHP